MSAKTGQSLHNLLKERQRFVTLESFFVLIAAWYVIGVVFGASDIVSSPIAVATFTSELLVSLEWVPHAIDTLRRIFIAFSIGLVSGILIALILGFTNFWEAVLKDFVITGLSMPTLLIVLFTAMWFGIGEITPVVAGVLVGLPYNAQIIYEGVKDIDADLVKMARSFDVSQERIAYRIAFKSVLSEILSAARLAFAGTWQVVALAEYIASDSGLGFMVRHQLAATSMTGLISWSLIFVAIIVFVEYGIFGYIESTVFAYRDDVAATMARA